MDLHSLLTPPKSVAVIGLSEKPDRPSYQVATYLLDHGFTIIPVNPNITHWKDLSSYPDLDSIPRSIDIDIIDIFRKSDEVLAIVNAVISTRRMPTIWMQEGVIDPVAKQIALDHDLPVIMDTCIMKTHRSLTQSTSP